jgi:galacturan 1,4-alpha-galacturonidase
MTVIHSENILLEDIYVNSTGNEPVGFEFSSLVSYRLRLVEHGTNIARNTDGADTVYANNITFRRWNVTNGDDSIAMKANSTNILIEDCDFYTGLGVAIGSIGQYDNAFETIENVTARNIRSYNMRYGAYVKTCMCFHPLFQSHMLTEQGLATLLAILRTVAAAVSVMLPTSHSPILSCTTTLVSTL